jgi:hypothetical protein
MTASNSLKTSPIALKIRGKPGFERVTYERVVAAVARSDYACAIALLKAVVHNGGNRPVQLKAGQLLQQLEQPADGRLARARQLQGQNQTAEAIATLEELVLTYPATETAVKAGQVLAGLTKE